MRLFRIACLLCLTSLAVSAAEIPDALLNTLKGATVLIRVNSQGHSSSGSGFLFKRSETSAFVITNAHVIRALDEGALADVILDSGLKTERRFPAPVVASDEQEDIAVLRVSDVKLPPSIDHFCELDLRETMPVYIFGFPFGSGLSLTSGNPAITIGRGSISSIRRDERGEVAYVQIDGDVNPGNSGGPLVDATGGLVGITVAKVSGTNIGLAIPVKKLEALFLGRVKGASLAVLEGASGRARLRTEVDLTDPMGRVARVTVVMAPRDRVKAAPRSREAKSFVALSDLPSDQFQLTLQKARAVGEVNLEGTGEKGVDYLFQVKLEHVDGVVTYNEPAPYAVFFHQRRSGAPSPVSSSDDWLTAGETPVTTAATGPKPPQKTKLLLRKTTNVSDATVASIDVDAREIAPSLCWSGDGKALFLLERRGTLRRIRVPEFEEELRLEIGHPCGSLQRSRAGLVLSLPDLEEVWVLDEENLVCKGKISVPRVKQVIASPASDVGFGTVSTALDLSVLDFAGRRVVKHHNARRLWSDGKGRVNRHPDSVNLSDFQMPAISPDGRYLFCVSFECLHRFRISGFDLVYEEVGPRIGANPQRLEISPDSTYVALPSGGGNGHGGVPCHDGPYCTHVYRVGNLHKPLLTVNFGSYPRTLGFDRQGGLIYGQCYETSLITWNPRTAHRKLYDLMKREDESTSFLVHPAGKRLLVVGQSKLLWVTVP